MADCIEVLLSSADGYSKRKLKEQFDRFAPGLDFPPSFSGDYILLKPNLITGRGPSYSCTNGHFLAALAEWFIDRGARIGIGDSPALGTAGQVLARRGMLELLKHLDYRVVEFKVPRRQDLSHGVQVGIAEEVLACDLFINIPRIKAHNQMFVTGAVKNLFGIVVGMRKALAHMKNGSSHLRFADLMLDLIDVLPPHATICDGIEVMHRQGPVNGACLTFGCVAGCLDPLALDTALLQALELDPRRAPIWRAAHDRQLPGSVPGNLAYPFLTPETFHGSGFIPPDELQPVVFNPFRFIVSSVRRMMLALQS